ncbi:MAG: hypothetical protein JWP25_358 [Bradyrhizobium sp.]|nr:hypothetical protein [Bradyrhizobium sp.]
MAARRSVNWKGLAPIGKVLSWPARASPSESNQDRGPRVGSERSALKSPTGPGRGSMTSGTARELDYVSSVRSLDCLFGQRGAVEAHVDQSLGKTLSVQLRDQGINHIH